MEKVVVRDSPSKGVQGKEVKSRRSGEEGRGWERDFEREEEVVSQMEEVERELLYPFTCQSNELLLPTEERAGTTHFRLRTKQRRELFPSPLPES